MSEPIRAHAQLYPGEIFINLIITLLARMFIDGAGGNQALARQAAAETLESYSSEGGLPEILLAGELIGFGLAALGSLSLSTANDIPIALALRLRNNANACNRSAQNARKALAANRPEPVPAQPPPPEPEPEIDMETLNASIAEAKRQTEDHLASVKATPAPQNPTPASEKAAEDLHYQAEWAASVARIAEETARQTPHPHGSRTPQRPSLDQRPENQLRRLHGRPRAASPARRRPRNINPALKTHQPIRN